MKMDMKVLGKHQAQSTTGTKKMRLSVHATSMVFQLFTKNVYSNPIGTVVREITSNCFDSHVEAGVNSPVLIRKSFDEQTDSHYISFIDYGVGMSPDRVENVYGVYFESTKRSNDNEIGGFGIGGKTPLAYKRSTGEGEGEYDNSFFVITNHDGQKYYYNVYEGTESPEWTLFHQEDTDERNGTEIRIPVLQRDISKFEEELTRQLYYFENIIFEGFSDRVQNEYQIVRGKSFLYRGDNLDSNMHVCLGRVYYPIDYNVMGMRYYDYQIPIAINVPIGAINVTVARESLDYSEQTINYLKKKIEEVKEELKGMLEKQYENIVSLEDYFKAKNNFGTLWLTDEKSIGLRRLMDGKKLDFSKYKYTMFNTPSSDELFKLFFDTTCYGKRELKGYSRNDFEQLTRSYEGLLAVKNVYYSDGEYSRKRLKQAYLRGEHGRFYVIVKSEMAMSKNAVMSLFNVHFDDTETYLQSDTYKTILKMQEEFFSIVRNHATDYNTVEVPEDFTIEYGKPKISEEIKNTTIPMKLHGSYGKTRVKVSKLIDFKGVIFYGGTDEEGKMDTCYNVFRTLYGDDHIASSYSRYNDTFGDKKSVMFITLAKNNLKYAQYFKNALTTDRFYHKMVARKENEITVQYRTSNFKERWNGIKDFYTSKLFAEVSPKWGVKIEEVRTFIKQLKDNSDKYSRRSDISYYRNYLKQYIDFDALTLTTEEKKVDKHLTAIHEIQVKNEQILKYFNTPSRGWNIVNEKTDTEVLVPILKKAMSL
jgi:hypothetical protein